MHETERDGAEAPLAKASPICGVNVEVIKSEPSRRVAVASSDWLGFCRFVQHRNYFLRHETPTNKLAAVKNFHSDVVARNVCRAYFRARREVV